MIDYRLYLVTDDPSRYAGDWLENVRAAVEGGVTCVQYRDTESPRAVQYERIRRLQDALRPFKTPIVVNNDAELAQAVRAEGVHVGQSDLPPEAVRALVGPSCEIGFSITSRADIRAFLSSETRRETVNCLGLGPVFDARKTKADAAPALGVDGLRALVQAVRASGVPALPLVAIGGLTPENAEAVIATGVEGLAVVSAFSKASDPFAAARELSALLK